MLGSALKKMTTEMDREILGMYDVVYVVVTVGVKKNSFKLRMIKPRLAQNQFAYRLNIKIDRKEWLDRIAEVILEKVKPTDITDFLEAKGLVEDDSETKIMKRLS